MEDTHAPIRPDSESSASQGGAPTSNIQARSRTPRITTDAHWEEVRGELLRLFHERRTLVEIASAFGISVNTAGAWRTRLIDDLRNEASRIQPRDFVMDSISSLQMARAEAWKTVSESTNVKDRRAGLHLVTQIEAQFAKLGVTFGLYGQSGDRPLQEQGGEDAGKGSQLIHSLMIEFLGQQEPDATP